jgi:hypothetical protein
MLMQIKNGISIAKWMQEFACQFKALSEAAFRQVRVEALRLAQHLGIWPVCNSRQPLLSNMIC